jgi:hypothetical protein
VLRDPQRLAYRDQAISRAEEGKVTMLMSQTRSTAHADRRRARAASAA